MLLSSRDTVSAPPSTVNAKEPNRSLYKHFKPSDIEFEAATKSFDIIVCFVYLAHFKPHLCDKNLIKVSVISYLWYKHL